MTLNTNERLAIIEDKLNRLLATLGEGFQIPDELRPQSGMTFWTQDMYPLAGSRANFLRMEIITTADGLLLRLRDGTGMVWRTHVWAWSEGQRIPSPSGG